MAPYNADDTAASGGTVSAPAAVPDIVLSGRGGHWDIRARLSSILARIYGRFVRAVVLPVEAFLDAHPFERGLWLVVAFGAGIVAWTALPGPAQRIAVILASGGTALAAFAFLDEDECGHVRLGVIGVTVMVAAGLGTVWTKSTLAGQPGIARPMVVHLTGEVIERRDERAKARVRLIVRTRLAGFDDPVLVRLNVPDAADAPAARESAHVRVRARLMPPAPPMLPGGYDFARTAWFSGIAATGSALGPVEVVRLTTHRRTLRGIQATLAAHVRTQLAGSPGNIAAALASGDRGAIGSADEDAMRDAGLTHLLSISGLHVSALVGAVYFLVARLLALLPWIALRIRVPVAGALAGALAGIAYTLLTGAEVPTVRSCIGALLVLAALVLGRDPLSLRLVAVGALVVMVFWPEAIVGPSFQMSFSAVIAIIAFHSAAPVRAFLSAPHYGPIVRTIRSVILLLATGVVIELALMPIGLFHFHRAGVYGALANVIAIPLTTFVIMPLTGLALLADLAGLGAPLWWLAGKALEFLLAIAHFVAARPGAVTMMPPVAPWSFAVFVGGMLWLGLWTGPVRLWGVLPAGAAMAVMLTAPVPDILVTGDGRHVGITGIGNELLVLRTGRGDYVRDSLLETAGMDGTLRLLDDWHGAQCSSQACVTTIHRGGRAFTLMLIRGSEYLDELELASACEIVDIVIASRHLPASCRPRMLKADRHMLAQTGGLTLNLSSGHIRTVAETQGRHGWYRWTVPVKSSPSTLGKGYYSVGSRAIAKAP